MSLPGIPQYLLDEIDRLRSQLAAEKQRADHAENQEKQTDAMLGTILGDLESLKENLQKSPVPTEVRCPQCTLLHVDQDEWATTRVHRKHLCHGCGHVWMPYAAYTIGVNFAAGRNIDSKIDLKVAIERLGLSSEIAATLTAIHAEVTAAYEDKINRLDNLVTDFKQACLPNCHDYDPSGVTPADVEKVRADRDQLRIALCEACDLATAEKGSWPGSDAPRFEALRAVAVRSYAGENALHATHKHGKGVKP